MIRVTAAFLMVFLVVLGGCGNSESSAESGSEKATASETEDEGYSQDFTFAGVWEGENEGEDITLTLNEDGTGTLAYSSIEEPFEITWEPEGTGETRRNVVIEAVENYSFGDITLNFWYEGPDTQRMPRGLILDDGEPAKKDGWMTWHRTQ